MGTLTALLLTAPMFGLKLAWAIGAPVLLLLARQAVSNSSEWHRGCVRTLPQRYILLCDRRTVDEVKRCSTRKPSANSSKG
jgi:hypothetical protein